MCGRRDIPQIKKAKKIKLAPQNHQPQGRFFWLVKGTGLSPTAGTVLVVGQQFAFSKKGQAKNSLILRSKMLLL